MDIPVYKQPRFSKSVNKPYHQLSEYSSFCPGGLQRETTGAGVKPALEGGDMAEIFEPLVIAPEIFYNNNVVGIVRN